MTAETPAEGPAVDGLSGLVATDATVIVLAEGFGFTEGPVWRADERCLVFSDIPGDARWRWSADGGAEQIARPTFKGNGMCLDAAGDLVVCEQVSSSVTVIRDGRRVTLAESYEGAYLNSPNDVVLGPDGSLYFTDPPYGRLGDRMGLARPQELPFSGVFRIPPDPARPLELVVDEQQFDKPNGLCFSPDGTILYVNDSAAGTIHGFPFASDGSLGRPELLAEGIGTGEFGTANPDGMKCEERGNVWVTGPGGVVVVSPMGERLGTVRVPELVRNHAWGGDDGHTLFLAATTTLRAIVTEVGPAAR